MTQALHSVWLHELALPLLTERLVLSATAAQQVGWESAVGGAIRNDPFADF